MNHPGQHNAVAREGEKERKQDGWKARRESQWCSARNRGIHVCWCIRVYAREMAEVQREIEKERGKDSRRKRKEEGTRGERNSTKKTERRREKSSGRGTREHGVDRALNPGPTGVLRRSTESLSGLELISPSWFTALWTLLSSLCSLFRQASSLPTFRYFQTNEEIEDGIIDSLT